MREISGVGGGEEEDQYLDHSKKARNVDSLKESQSQVRRTPKPKRSLTRQDSGY